MKRKKIVIEFVYEKYEEGFSVHEALCKAIHEGSAEDLVNLTDCVTDIRVAVAETDEEELPQ